MFRRNTGQFGSNPKNSNIFCGKERIIVVDRRFALKFRLLTKGLPETPLRASAQDRKLARQLHERGVALPVVESAFLLASVRRLVRPMDVPALSPIRSLAYFQPVIEELLSHPARESYVEYLRLKVQQLSQSKLNRKQQAATG